MGRSTYSSVVDAVNTLLQRWCNEFYSTLRAVGLTNISQCTDRYGSVTCAVHSVQILSQDVPTTIDVGDVCVKCILSTVTQETVQSVLNFVTGDAFTGLKDAICTSAVGVRVGKITAHDDSAVLHSPKHHDTALRFTYLRTIPTNVCAHATDSTAPALSILDMINTPVGLTSNFVNDFYDALPGWFLLCQRGAVGSPIAVDAAVVDTADGVDPAGAVISTDTTVSSAAHAALSNSIHNVSQHDVQVSLRLRGGGDSVVTALGSGNHTGAGNSSACSDSTAISGIHPHTHTNLVDVQISLVPAVPLSTAGGLGVGTVVDIGNAVNTENTENTVNTVNTVNTANGG
uniref:Uncharacterized protein n=1 Tax=Lygus hesperus TaxID=30085 RepID=A0A146L4D5_LYGHE